MALFIPDLGHSTYRTEVLQDMGRISYEGMDRGERHNFAQLSPRDLKKVLESAAIEPPNHSLLIAISAICARGYMQHTSHKFGYFHVGRLADSLLD